MACWCSYSCVRPLFVSVAVVCVWGVGAVAVSSVGTAEIPTPGDHNGDWCSSLVHLWRHRARRCQRKTGLLEKA